MKIRINPSRAKGVIQAPPSKSMAHRMLICAGLAQGESVIQNIDLSEDIKATLDCLEALGVDWEYLNRSIYLTGINILEAQAKKTLYCRESGSTMRFFVPIALATGKETKLSGSPSLLKRPMNVYEKLSQEKDFVFDHKEDHLFVQGPLASGHYVLPGDVSSQFITGLLFVLPLLDQDSVIEILEPIESKSYIEMTLEALANFGVEVLVVKKKNLHIPGQQKYKNKNTKVEGDYSNAAFLDAFNLFDGQVQVEGLNPLSNQGDKVYKELYKDLAHQKVQISLQDCPDLGPILFALAAALQGGDFTDTKRLAIKESNRAHAMGQELEKFGVSIAIQENEVQVPGGQLQAPQEELYGHNDHRIVMACAILCSLVGGTIDGAEAVNKSYPNFFKDLKDLGVEVEVL